MKDERFLILDAIKHKDSNTPKVELDFDFSEPDAIDKYIKRKKRLESFKFKGVEEWNNSDFLHYLDFMLKDFGVRREKGNIRSDSNTLNRLYDIFVKHLKEKMNNIILKKYMEWWCSIWAPRLSGSEINLNYLMQDFQIRKFVTRYNEDENSREIIPPKNNVNVDDNSIFELGGIDLLIMKRGIVVGYRILRQRSVSNPEQVIQNALCAFEKETLSTIMDLTINLAPYSNEDKIDFVSLAKPALMNHNLTQFLQVQFERYFRSLKT